MSSKDITYTYWTINNCNMCGAGNKEIEVLGKRLNQSQGFSPQTKLGITTTIVQCVKCNLIFSNPMPIPQNIDDHYGVSPSDYWKEEYFNIDERYFMSEIEWLRKLIPFENNQKTLDIGAGLGKQMISLKSAGYDSYGIEPSSTFYKMSIEKMGIPKDKLFNIGVENAVFEKDSFDFISFGAVLEHLYNPSGAIKLAMNWLKPGGIIHIEVPNSRWLIAKLLNIQYKLRGLDYVTNLSPMHSPFHLYEFSLKSFEKNGKQNGYKVEDFKYYVCETFMPKLIEPLLRKYMSKTNTGMQLCVWLKKI